MIERGSHCDPVTLQNLICGQLLEENAQAALEHIDQCPQCRDALCQLAALPEEWESVRSALAPRNDLLEKEYHQRTPSVVGFGSHVQIVEEVTAGKNGANATWPTAYLKSILDEPSHPEMLGRIGRYDVERLIGCGGMGIVFKAFDTELNRPVAIKMLAPSLAHYGVARYRFAREAKAAAAVVHEHIVPIYNVESSGELPYLVMHYAQGDSLQSRIDRNGPLELKEILRISQQIASGLAAAHSQGLVHRDVKPANVLLENGIERALISDFGLALAADDASLSCSGFLAGTPQFMSPEQARGDKVNHLSDLFSLGSVMYTMCTGQLPFVGDSTLAVLQKVQASSPQEIIELNPDLPLWLSVIVGRLMRKLPSDRFQSAAEVAELLENCLAHVQQPLDHSLPKQLLKYSEARSSATWLRSGIIFSLGLIILLLIAAVWKFEVPFSQPIASINSTDGKLQATATPPSIQTRRTSESKTSSNARPIVWIGPSIGQTPTDKLRSRLETTIKVDWEGKTIADCLKEALQMVGVDVAFSAASKQQSPTFFAEKMSWHSDTTVKQLLQRTLSRYQLGYLIRDSYIEVTTLDEVGERPFLDLYDVSRIASSSREVEKLTRIVVRSIQPDVWYENGGNCTISSDGPVLYVRATESVHQELIATLSSISSAAQ